MSRVCSYCACPGHNRATCEVRHLACILLVDDEPVSRNCSYCGCSGHDKRNCLAYNQLTQFLPEQEVVTTPLGCLRPPAPPTGGHGPIPVDLASIRREINFNTALKMSDRLNHTHKQVTRVPKQIASTNIARRFTQIIDFDVYDEPWVWAPIPRDTTSVTRFTANTEPQPVPQNIIFT